MSPFSIALSASCILNYTVIFAQRVYLATHLQLERYAVICDVRKGNDRMQRSAIAKIWTAQRTARAY